MKVVNGYTISLIIISCVSFLFSITHVNMSFIPYFLILAGIVIVLEICPIRLPSGDQYSAGSIGFLFLLIHSGFSYSILVIFLATAAYYIKGLKKRKIRLIHLFVTIGMYVGSTLASLLVWNWTESLSLLIRIGLVSIVFEMVNFMLLEGIEVTVFGKKMFTNLKTKIVELLIPVVVSIIVLSRWALVDSETELLFTMFYSLFFLLVVNFFSHEFVKQLTLRQSISEAFIQVLEGRITPSLAGHGNRVGVICDTILEDFNYPKRKRFDLVQAATIHDIGKAILPSYIFRKRGDMTLSEEREYQTHPEKAVEMVKTMFPKESFSEWILYHHERWDGKGFPKGLQGEEIPIESRILALANELDHIISRNHDAETILKLLVEKSGTWLDPQLVEKVELHHIEQVLENVLPYKEETKEESAQLYANHGTYSNLGESFFIKVKNGTVVSPKNDPPVDFVLSLAEMASRRKGGVHETFTSDHQTFDLHAQLESSGEVTIFVHDLTPYLGYRKSLEQNILESYVEVINTVSDGKIMLYPSKKGLLEKLGEQIADISIKSNSDVPKSRKLTLEVLQQIPTEINSMQVQVAVSEAVTNILKHATSGNLSIFRRDQLLQFFISDKGSGIPLHEIPKTILVSGYSSKRSLGQGFKMISNFSNGVSIYTSSEGTSILIEYRQQTS
ncbi:HD domain-containing phosphohydrolase [Neobacillus rhizosphaerae]|uniref:HD domain-containing phosphohydrolase n=1 Tax=Neobacillus rhizosphaerae TaxID=2880965 RepID=UPI003D26ED43